jgi:hypothetical protein
MGYVVVAAFAIGLAIYFNITAGRYPATAARFPILLTYIVIALALFMVAETAKNVLAGRARKVVADLDRWQVIAMVTFSLAIIAYVAVLERAGYVLATGAFLLGSLLAYRAIPPAWAVTVTMGVMAVIYGLFIYFLRLPMPLAPTW